MRVIILTVLTTDKPVALGCQIVLEFRNVGFCGGRKSRVPGEKLWEPGFFYTLLLTVFH